MSTTKKKSNTTKKDSKFSKFPNVPKTIVIVTEEPSSPRDIDESILDNLTYLEGDLTYLEDADTGDLHFVYVLKEIRQVENVGVTTKKLY